LSKGACRERKELFFRGKSTELPSFLQKREAGTRERGKKILRFKRNGRKNPLVEGEGSESSGRGFWLHKGASEDRREGEKILEGGNLSVGGASV